MKRYHKYRFPKQHPLRGQWVSMFAAQYPYPYSTARGADGYSFSYEEVRRNQRLRLDTYAAMHNVNLAAIEAETETS